jgi:hypothetical protein
MRSYVAAAPEIGEVYTNVRSWLLGLYKFARLKAIYVPETALVSMFT